MVVPAGRQSPHTARETCRDVASADSKKSSRQTAEWRLTTWHPHTAAMSDAAPAQYKQKSRKGKKAWRKNVDVTAVASGLDEVRDQIIAG